MLNIRRKSGTAPLRYTVLAVGSLIMGMVGITYGYTEIQNCYDTNKPCRDYGVNESYDTNGATISYGAYLNTPGYSKSFMVQYDYTNSSSITFKIRQYLIYNENGYYSIIQAFQRETEPQKTSIYLYTGSTGYCIPEENNNRCGNASNSFRPYNKSIELVNSGINGSIMTGYRVMYSDTNATLAHVICPMFENGFIFCMPFRQQNNNGSISNSQYYGLTRTTISEDTIPPFNDREYITNNYTIGNTPFTITAPQTTPQITLGTCPTIQQLIDAYGTEYNESLCYSAKRLLTETGIVITTPQSIFELFPTYDEWKEGYNTYQNYCRGTSTEICRQAFSGEQAQWSIYNKAPTDTIGLYQYCHLQLEIEDKTQTTCVLSTGAIYATGVNEAIWKESMSNQSAVDIMIGSMVNMENVIPTSGSVLDALKPEGENRKINRNILESIQELYGTFMNLFHYRSGVQGIIPEYITRIILVILLFYILKK